MIVVKTGGNLLPHRIIYCALGCASLLTLVSHETLRKFDQGAIVSVSDESMSKLFIKESEIPILYFSRDDYDQAIRDLDEDEIDNALRKRLKEWSPQALDQALQWIAINERRPLALTAQSLRTAPGDKQQLLETHFNSGLDLLTSIAAPGRYDEMDLRDLLMAIVESEAMLIKELPQSQESQTRLQFADALARELKRHGRGEFAAALPYAEQERGAWVTPLDPSLKSYLKTRGIAAAEWRNGIVAPLPLRALDDFRKTGKQVEILYADPGALMQDFFELTGAQLFRRFRELSAADDAARSRQMNDYRNVLRITIAVQRRALRKRATREDTVMTSLLNQQIFTETKILAEQLAATRSWLSPGDVTAPLQRLHLAEQELADDTAFLLSLALKQNHAHLKERLKEIQRIKEDDLKRAIEIKS